MSAFPRTIPVRLNADGTIDADVDCPACGYNLRMQSVEGGCPECGVKIDVSEREDSDALSNADPAWRRRIARGTRWLHGGAVASLALVLPGLVWAAAALWLLTTKEPKRRETWYARGTRLSARWAGVLAATAAIATVVLMIMRYGGAAAASFGGMFSGGPAGINPLLRIQKTVAPMLSDDWSTLDLLLCTAGASMAVALLEAWRHLFALAARADGAAVAQRCRRTWKRYLLGVGLIVSLAVATNLVEWMDWRLPSVLYEWTAILLVGFVLAVLLWMWWATLGLTRELVKVLGN